MNCIFVHPTTGATCTADAAIRGLCKKHYHWAHRNGLVEKLAAAPEKAAGRSGGRKPKSATGAAPAAKASRKAAAKVAAAPVAAIDTERAAFEARIRSQAAALNDLDVLRRIRSAAQGEPTNVTQLLAALNSFSGAESLRTLILRWVGSRIDAAEAAVYTGSAPETKAKRTYTRKAATPAEPVTEPAPVVDAAASAETTPEPVAEVVAEVVAETVEPMLEVVEPVAEPVVEPVVEAAPEAAVAAPAEKKSKKKKTAETPVLTESPVGAM